MGICEGLSQERMRAIGNYVCRGGDWVFRGWSTGVVALREIVASRQLTASSSGMRWCPGRVFWNGETGIESDELGRIVSNYFRPRVLRWLEAGELVAGGVAMFGAVQCVQRSHGRSVSDKAHPKWHQMAPNGTS